MFAWRKLASQGALTATAAEEEVVAASEYRALQNQVQELQRLVGKKTMEAQRMNRIIKDALWDPRKSVVIKNEILHHGADYTPYEGLAVTGWPVRVIVRGKTVTDGDALVAQKGLGSYLARARSLLFS